jgi:tRNA(fMet)-specific endonuclease VapC
MVYMLDTNICIHLLQGQPANVVAKFAGLRAGDVVISAITYAELRHGVERLDKDDRAVAERVLAALTEKLPVLPLDENAGISYGILAVKAKRSRDALDRLIAAHAVSVDATLVTNNVSDFRGYAGLRVENWVDG